MKRFKYLVVVFMAVLLFATNISNVFAINSEEIIHEKIYYSDLFYTYSTEYLLDGDQDDYYDEASHVFDRVYCDYVDSPKFIWTGIKSTLATAFDAKEWITLVASTYGPTDYTYLRALDKANEMVATNLLKPRDTASNLATAAKCSGRLKQLFSLFQTFEQTYDVYSMTEYEIYEALFAETLTGDVFVYVGESNVTKVKQVVLPDVSKYTDMLSDTKDALTAAKAIVTGVMLEDLRMEVLDDLMSQLPTGSTLYDGMSRLKTQLREGFASYFFDNYLTKKVLGAIADGIIKQLTPEIMTSGLYKLITKGLEIASWIVFDVIFDIPSIDDLTTQRVLADYVKDSYNLLTAHVDTFNKQFDAADVHYYEALFKVMVASVRSSVSASESLVVDSTEELYQEFIDQWSDYDYDEYIELVKIRFYLGDNGKRKNFEFWEYNEGDVFRKSSDYVEENSIYLQENTTVFNGNIITRGTAEQFETADGDIVDLTGEIGYRKSDGTIDFCDYNISINNDEITLNSYLGSQTDVVIPSKLLGFSVTRLYTRVYGTFEWCSDLTSITIPDSVTSIGERAFHNCSSLTGVYITDIAAWCGISFGNYCSNPLYYAKNLYLNNTLVTSVIIPDSVTTIGDYAFYGCSSLTSVIISDSVTHIGRSAFDGCSSLTSITIPDSVTYIGKFAFDDCSSLTSITIPDGVTSIGTAAFAGCSSLTSISIPDSVTSIGDHAFSGCSNLTSITIPDSVTSIGGWAFYDCSSLTSVTIPDSVTSIGERAFADCSSLTSITIGNSLTSIGSAAFLDCSSLTSVTIGGGVTSIGEDAFWGCSSLTSIIIPDSVTSIGDSAFYKCSSLTSITIPDSVTSIGDCAFADCSSLTSITIPDSVTRIRGHAFADCSGLTSIIIPDSVTSIGYDAFRGCSSLTSITIPDSVTSIGSSAFSGCSNLTSVTISESVTSIDYDAFYGCSSLTSITIPDSVTSIGYDAFAYCSGLTSVNISNIAAWCKISFANDSANPLDYAENLYLKGELVTDLVIPDSVTSIVGYAFYDCDSLTSITIPDSVTSIGYSAFDGCSSLATVEYLGNEEQWNDISIGSSNDPLINAEIFFHNLSTEEHIYDSGVVAKVPTCAEEGVKVYTCSCGVTKAEVLPKRAHNYVNGICSICSKVIEGLSYTITDGVVTITDYTGDITNVVLPSNIEGYLVTSIGDNAFSGCTSLANITLPNSVTSIGSYAFSGCSSLTSITMPDSVTSIGSYAFSNCAGLKGVYITDIGKWCGISFGSYNANPLYYATNLFLDDKLVTELVIPDGVTKINEYAFRRCTSLTSVIIGNSVTSIGNSAFYNCSSLTSVTIPDSVTSIGTSAFEDCSGLTSIIIPDNVTSIGNYAFEGCSGLTSVSVGNSVTSIGNSAFRSCSSLTSVIIPYSVRTIGQSAFSGCTALNNLVFSNKVTRVFGSAFYNCEGLKTVYYMGTSKQWAATSVGSYNDSLNDASIFYLGDAPIEYDEYEISYVVSGITINAYMGTDSEICIPKLFLGYPVKSIGRSAFEECDGLASVVIPDGVTTIGASAFRGCSGLISVSIPDSVTSIGNYAFEKSTGLVSAIIGNGVTSIGYCVFYGCTSLTNVTIPDSVTSIGDNAFFGCSGLTSIIIPDSVTSIGGQAFRDCSNLTSVIIPDSVTNIGGYAFCNCTGLTNIIIPDSVTSIGSRAFSGCSGLTTITVAAGNTTYKDIDGVLFTIDSKTLIRYPENKTGTSYIIPDDVTSIGDYAFYKCSSLTSVTVGDGVSSIGGSAFSGCSGLTGVTIPESVTSIGSGAFLQCNGLTGVYITDIAAWCGISFGNYCSNPLYYAKNLYLNNTLVTSVIIPDSVTSIGSWTFNSCDNLSVVAYRGTAEQFSNITIGSSNDPFVNAKKLYLGDLTLANVSLTLHDDLTVNYKVGQSVIDDAGWTDPYVVISFDGAATTVKDPTVTDGKYVFSFTNIAPYMMNDTITATIYATYDGKVYEGETIEYSISKYCYAVLDLYSADTYTKIRTLMVDLLNYGAQSQMYAGHNTSALVNAALTETQSAWGTQASQELTSVLNAKYEMVEDPAVSWKSAGLFLEESITMRFKIAADSIDGLTVKVNGAGYTWTIPASKFTATDGGYYFYFDGLNASQVSEPVYLTVYSGDTAVSNTLCFSAESYAYAQRNSSDANLVALLDTMMKYGKSAYNYMY